MVDANPFTPMYECFCVDDSTKVVPIADALDDLVVIVAERNFDFYEERDGRIRRA